MCSLFAGVVQLVGRKSDHHFMPLRAEPAKDEATELEEEEAG